MRLAAAVVLAAACLAAAGCLPEERLNRACRWTDTVTALPPAGDPARRAHLVEDVRVAVAIGIRHADSVPGRLNTPAYRESRRACIAASMDQIARRHGVPRAELDALVGAREYWIDLLAVFLPVALAFLLVIPRITRRVVASYDPEDRSLALASLAVLTPMLAGAALVMTQMWGVVVEGMRVRDEHLGPRMALLPASRHWWLVWGIGVVVFAVVVAATLRRGVPRLSPPPRGAARRAAPSGAARAG